MLTWHSASLQQFYLFVYFDHLLFDFLIHVACQKNVINMQILSDWRVRVEAKNKNLLILFTNFLDIDVVSQGNESVLKVCSNVS